MDENATNLAQPRFQPGTGYIVVLAATALIVAALDQLTKIIAVANLEYTVPVEFIGDLVRFTLIFNKGGAFGSSIGSNIVYILVSIAVIVIVFLVFYRRIGQSKLVDFSLFAVIGGAIGNLIDRFARGAVVDFIEVDIPDINFAGIVMNRWPIFNIADIAVSLGMIALIIYFLRPSKPGEGQPNP